MYWYLFHFIGFDIMALENGNSWVSESSLSHQEAKKLDKVLGQKAKEFIRNNRLYLMATLMGLCFVGVKQYDKHLDQFHQEEIQRWLENHQRYVDALYEKSFLYTVQEWDASSVLLERLGLPYSETTMDDFCELNPDFVNTLRDDAVVPLGKKSLGHLQIGDVIRLWGDSTKLQNTDNVGTTQDTH